MVTDWIFAASIVAAWVILGMLIYRYEMENNDIVPPWEGYHRAFRDAQLARAQFLRNGLFTARRSLKDRICWQARKWHIRLCPLCC